MTSKPHAPYVTHDAGVLAGAVVLRPSTAVDRLPPLHGEPSPIGERAIEQHGILVRTLRDRGIDVTVLDAQAATCAESLVGDTAVVLPDGAVMMRPSDAARRKEVAAIERALGTAGVPIAGRIAGPGLLDGGDVVLAGGTAYIGVPSDAGLAGRSNSLGRAQFADLARAQGITVVELALAPGIRRLRNVFNVVGPDLALAAPNRVDLAGVSGLRLVELPLGEEYAAGVLSLGGRRVLANLRYRESIKLMRKAKLAVEAIDLWEFGKAGAGPSSLVLAVARH